MSIFDFNGAKGVSTFGSLNSAPLSVLLKSGAPSHQLVGAPFGNETRRKRLGAAAVAARTVRGAKLSSQGSARQIPAPRSTFLRDITRDIGSWLLLARERRTNERSSW